MPLPPEDVERLIRAEHWDPFSLLGPHPITASGHGAVIRAFLPEAEEATVLLDEADDKAVPMTKVHEAVLFEAVRLRAHGTGFACGIAGAG